MYIPAGFLTITASVNPGCPSPAQFTATTRTIYFAPSLTPYTVNVWFLCGLSVARDQSLVPATTLST